MLSASDIGKTMTGLVARRHAPPAKVATRRSGDSGIMWRYALLGAALGLFFAAGVLLVGGMAWRLSRSANA